MNVRSVRGDNLTPFLSYSFVANSKFNSFESEYIVNSKKYLTFTINILPVSELFDPLKQGGNVIKTTVRSVRGDNLTPFSKPKTKTDSFSESFIGVLILVLLVYTSLY